MSASTIDEGVGLRDIASRWPSTWAFMGGISYRALRYGRMKEGEFVGSGMRCVYTVADMRRLLIRHQIAMALGGSMSNAIPRTVDAAIDLADWTVHGEVIVALSPDVSIIVRLSADVWTEVAP